MCMAFNRQGGFGRGIRTAGYIILLLALPIILGGCAWIGNWINPNQAPIAAITVIPSSGEVPLEVTFDASESYDLDGDTLVYEWDFGDGET